VPRTSVRAAYDSLHRLSIERRELRLRLFENQANVCLSSISGGTDLCSCFALGNPIGPVYRANCRPVVWG